MDAEMEEAAVEVFVCFEIDLDYEFDAVKFFDLGRDESPEEKATAERWFEGAGSHPPSPLIAKMFCGKDVQMERKNGIGALLGDALPGVVSFVDSKGWALQNLIQQDEQNVKNGSTVKNRPAKVSTLMKPTASQLAKQNQSCRTKTFSRIQSQCEVKTRKSFGDSNEFAHQAVKRQRLEQGHYSKILGVNPQIDLFHKTADKKIMLPNFNSQLPRMKLTIPREPELQTSRRAIGLRPRQSSQDNTNKFSEGTTSTSTFKALPLNRKILEAPTLPLRQRTTPQLPKFKEFNLKTHERALQHTDSSASSRFARSHADLVKSNVKSSQIGQCHNSGLRLHNFSKPAEEVKEPGYRFKAQSFIGKADLSKGYVSLFRRTKPEPKPSKEVNLSATGRCQQVPLTELFNKLCVTTEAQMTASDPTTDMKFELPCYCLDSKDTKENLIDSGQQ